MIKCEFAVMPLHVCIIMCAFLWVYLSTADVLWWHEMKEFSRPVWKHTHSCRGWINPAGCSQMSSFHADSRSCCCLSSSSDRLSSPNWGKRHWFMWLFISSWRHHNREETWTFDQVCGFVEEEEEVFQLYRFHNQAVTEAQGQSQLNSFFKGLFYYMVPSFL